MSKRIGVLLLLLLGIGFCGLFVMWVSYVREKACIKTCTWNLKVLAMGLGNFHDLEGHYPTATLLNPALPAEKRLSWQIQMLHFFGIGGGEGAWWPVFDRKRAWDDPVNFPVKEKNSQDRIQLMSGYYDFFCCPANPSRETAMQNFLTMYIGLTGIGEDAALLPLTDSRVGFFGYDRKITRKDISDGFSTTVMITETGQNNGCWFMGGPATARGLVENGTPYLGESGQFSSFHRHRSSAIAFQSVSASNFAFVDGSVRPILEEIAPEILKALVTIRGGEAVPPFSNE